MYCTSCIVILQILNNKDKCFINKFNKIYIMNYKKGILFKLLNIVLFSSTSLIFSTLGEDISVPHLMFLMTLFGFVTLLIVVIYLRDNIGFKGGLASNLIKFKYYKQYLFISVFNMLGLITWYKSLQLIGANEATAITYITPIFTIILAIIFCGERLNYRCFVGIIISFCGMYFIINPKFHLNLSICGVIMAILASMMWATYNIIFKKQTQTEHYLMQTLYILFFTALLMLPYVLYNYYDFKLILMSYKTILIILVMGVMTAMNNIVAFIAYKNASINMLMPFSYLRLLFVAVPNYILFDKILYQNQILGLIIIAISSALVFLSLLNTKKQDN